MEKGWDTYLTVEEVSKLTFSLEKTLVKQRYRVTLDLKSPSFHRSASRPSVVVEIYKQRGIDFHYSETRITISVDDLLNLYTPC